MFSHPLSRRRLLQHGAIATGAIAGLMVIPRPLIAMLGGRPEPVPPIRDPRVKELVQRGLDAARTAGASYADVRMTYTRNRGYMRSHTSPSEQERLHASVRALVDGYWGFATSPVWSPDELTRLGTEATRQAKANTLGKVRTVVMPSATPVRDGHWATPVRIDPFALHPQEIIDHLFGVGEQLENVLGRLDRYGEKYQRNMNIGVSFGAMVQDKAFGSTDGTYCTQRLHRSRGSVKAFNPNGGGDDRDLLTPSAVGWELYLDNPIVDRIRESIQLNKELARLPVKPIDVGRYATVFDAKSVAHLLARTIGPATEIDRALGYEANAGGTSYVIDPDEMFQTFRLGSNQLTVTANRNEPGGLATTRWDDEGVEPQSFTPIEGGKLAGFHTSREGTGWLQNTYTRTGQAFRSHGCMYAETGGEVPYIRVANLVMQPGFTAQSLQDLEAGIGNGMSITGFGPDMDFQMMNGFSNSFGCFEIKGGKRVARIANAGMLFRTQELWNNILAIGGAASAQRFGTESIKGEPKQTAYHSMTAVPMAVKELTYIDPERR